MSHESFRFDDYYVWGEFWNSINAGYLDMNYKWEFEKFWGKGAKAEVIYLSEEDYDDFQQKLNEPPQYNENLAKLMKRPLLWENEND